MLTPQFGSGNRRYLSAAALAAVLITGRLADAAKPGGGGSGGGSTIPNYSVEFLVLDDPRSAALGLNDLGDVVGWSRSAPDANGNRPQIASYFTLDANGNRLGFYLQELLPPDSDWEYLWVANDINNSGMIVGSGRRDGKTKAFRAQIAGSPTGPVISFIEDLGDTGSASFVDATAVSINEAGVICGRWRETNAEGAFIWTASGPLQKLGPLPNGLSAVPMGINDAHQVCGGSNNSSSAGILAWRYTPGIGMQLLGTTKRGFWSYGKDIDPAGNVVGYMAAGTGYHAFLYDAAAKSYVDLKPLGAARSQANGINNAKQIVGTAEATAFLYTPASGAVNLQSKITNLPPVFGMSPQRISSTSASQPFGTICGFLPPVFDDNGEVLVQDYRAFVLHPLP